MQNVDIHFVKVKTLYTKTSLLKEIYFYPSPRTSYLDQFSSSNNFVFMPCTVAQNGQASCLAKRSSWTKLVYCFGLAPSSNVAAFSSNSICLELYLSFAMRDPVPSLHSSLTVTS